MPTYKNVDRRFPTSVSHGFLTGMGNQMQKIYGPPPGLDNKPIMSQSNLYRAHMEEMNDNWNNHHYPQEAVFPKSTSYMQPNASTNHMIPSALRTQPQPSFPVMRVKPMSTEFNYNFGSKLINENEDKFGVGYLENDSDSDGHEGDSFYPRFASKADHI